MLRNSTRDQQRWIQCSMLLPCQRDIAVDPHSVSAQSKEDTIVSITLWFQALWLWQGFKRLVDFVINSFHVLSSKIMEEIFVQKKPRESYYCPNNIIALLF